MMKGMLTPYQICLIVCTTLLLRTNAQDPADQCTNKFSKGKEGFVLDTDDSVMEGAAYLGSPSVSRVKECVSACCSDPSCNLALMENGDVEGTIKSCFIFNCFYKQKKVCRFIRKNGFNNYVLTSVFSDYLKAYDPNQEDKPPKANGGQDRVVQPHDIVMLNGLESTDDHEIVDYQWDLVSGNSSAVIEKTNNEDQVTVSNLYAGVYKFRLTVTDNAGQSDSAEITVLVLTPEQSHHHCLVPKKEGPCRGSFPRWHYNAAAEKCQKFNFGGCKENRNNYLSEQECLKACDKVSVYKPPSGRLGPTTPGEEECGVSCGPEKFTCANRCCIDKELECDSVKQCSDGSDEETCENYDSRFRRLLDLDTEEDKGAAASDCTLPPVTGTCRGSETMWYYNPYDQKCHHFNYGGCDGNNNRFRTESDCKKYCNGVTEKDAFGNRGIYEKASGEENDSVYVAIAVALGLAILILLIVIGYCVLRRKKQRQPRQKYIAANGTHLHPVDDTDRLVYNSTTKPI